MLIFWWLEELDSDERLLVLLIDVVEYEDEFRLEVFGLVDCRFCFELLESML